MLRAPDAAVFEAARSAGVVVVTNDGDFPKLLEWRGSPPRVVWITCGNVHEPPFARHRALGLAV